MNTRTNLTEDFTEAAVHPGLCSDQGANNELWRAPMLQAKSWRPITTALYEDKKKIHGLASLTAFTFANTAFLLLLALYGTDSYELSAERLATLLPSAPSAAVPETGYCECSAECAGLAHTCNRPGIQTCAARSQPPTSGKPPMFSEFLRGARQLNPLYSIIPALFIVWLTFLNWFIESCTPGAKNLKLLWNEWLRAYAAQLHDPRWARDLTLDIRPVVLTSLCLAPPACILMMIYSSIQAFTEYLFPRRQVLGVQEKFGHPCLTLGQSEKHLQARNDNFYCSGWFNTIIALPYLLGVPTAITIWIYYNLGIDAQLDYPSYHKYFFQNIFIIESYLYCLGTCLTLLFFRSYFAFALNFDSSNFDIEVYPDVIKKLPIKGWFMDYLLIGGRENPKQIPWCEVKRITFATNRFVDETADSHNNSFSLVMHKIGSVYESVAEGMRTSPDYICIESDIERINIQLWHLSYRQKLDLFHAIRTYGSHVPLDDKVQTALVGTSVMQESKFTQLWFDVLTAAEQQDSEGDLERLHQLQDEQYQVQSKITSGGQATVYEANTPHGEVVILKEFRLVTNESLDAKMESAREFENESTILSQLKHESIVEMLDMFYESGRMYLVLEKVRGRTLRQIVSEDGVMSEGCILKYCQQMAEILMYLHQQEPPVVHRDFTPENIIVQPGGQLKLIDFSIAQASTKNRTSPECAGKHAYTPPEQFAGKYCPQSDLYALGATLFFMATGQDAEPITKSYLPSEIASQMPRLNRIIGNCTELDLESRYSSSAWVLAELRQSPESDQPQSEHKTMESTIAIEHPIAMEIRNLEEIKRG